MKYTLVGLLLLSLVACKPKQTADTLPKDAAEKPAYSTDKSTPASSEKIAKRLAELRVEFEKIKNEPCTDAASWKFAPVGSKSCGGPQFYTAFPIAKEAETQKLISEYTQLDAEFQRINQLLSDCSLVEAPAELQCVNGKILMQPKLAVEQAVVSEGQKSE